MFMSILNCFPHQKSIKYNTIIEDEIFFSESISSVIRKIGKSENTEKREHQTTLKYKRKLHAHILTAYYCFDDGKLCSVCYESDVLTDNESQHFLSEIENVISENIFDSVIQYTSCGKEYWELTDGAVSMQICLYAENNIVHIKIDCFD